MMQCDDNAEIINTKARFTPILVQNVVTYIKNVFIRVESQTQYLQAVIIARAEDTFKPCDTQR